MLFHSLYINVRSARPPVFSISSTFQCEFVKFVLYFVRKLSEYTVHILHIIQYTLQFSQYLNKRARQIKSNTEIVMKHVFQFNEIVFNVICW